MHSITWNQGVLSFDGHTGEELAREESFRVAEARSTCLEILNSWHGSGTSHLTLEMLGGRAAIDARDDGFVGAMLRKGQLPLPERLQRLRSLSIVMTNTTSDLVLPQDDLPAGSTLLEVFLHEQLHYAAGKSVSSLDLHWENGLAPVPKVVLVIAEPGESRVATAWCRSDDASFDITVGTEWLFDLWLPGLDVMDGCLLVGLRSRDERGQPNEVDVLRWFRDPAEGFKGETESARLEQTASGFRLA